MTPTTRTLQELRRRGYLADVTEKWIPGANIRRDLFGFIDLIYLTRGGIIAVQCTSTSNVSARIKKIRLECRDGALAWLHAGGVIEVWGWRKYAQRVDGKLWRPTCREVIEATIEKDQQAASV